MLRPLPLLSFDGWMTVVFSLSFLYCFRDLHHLLPPPWLGLVLARYVKALDFAITIAASSHEFTLQYQSEYGLHQTYITLWLVYDLMHSDIHILGEL